MLRDLRTLFLATTQRSSQAAVSLADELDVVDAFIGVARARHGDTLTFSRDLDQAALSGVGAAALAAAARGERRSSSRSSRRPVHARSRFVRD